MRGKAQATVVLEQAILDIVGERAPITVRGVCYALFVRGLIESMAVRDTGRISRIMTAMREAETLAWEKIVDGSRAVERPPRWDNPDEVIDAAVRGYRRDNWQDQPVVVEVWSEKSTVQGVLAPVLNALGVTFRIMKGFGSFTAVMQAADDDMSIEKPTVALYIGDWDPSGLYMSEVDLPDRLERYGGQQELKRIAIVQEDTPHLPHFDVATKRGDARYQWFVQHFGHRCWELDAIDPNDLRDRVRAHIVAHIDRALWARAIEIEKAQTDTMNEFFEEWQRLHGGQL
jgi:hypothetical protein